MKELKSCELLSFIVLLLFENSSSSIRGAFAIVVNCFHLSYFCSLKTAAFNFGVHNRCCELLSFIVLLLYENSILDF